MNRASGHSQIDPLRIIPHTRPLYFHGGQLYCSRFNRICSTSDYGRTFSDEGRLELVLPFRGLIGLSKLAQRVVRCAVYRMRVLPDGTRVFTFRGGVYVQPAGASVAHRTYTVERGSRPVSLAVGADGLIVFGEYWANREREAVRVIGSRDAGQTWNELFVFGAGDIRHVHGISYDRREDCFWICTGDVENENQLLRATADFSEVKIVRQGGQGNRFYAILVGDAHLVTATDTPLEDNFICVIDKRTGELSRATPIENTSFYNCSVGDMTFVSTNAEPSAVNDVDASHVWAGNVSKDDWQRILTFPVDGYEKLTRLPRVPSGLFQYPRVFFPEGENPGNILVCHAIGVRGYDGAMLCYDTGAWSS